MNSQPRPNQNPSNKRQQTAARMLRVVRAHHMEDLHEVQERDERIGQLAPDCGTVEFCWQTDAHECHFRVYFQFEDEAQIVAVRLDQFDYRLPSLQERIHWEDQFNSELDREDVTWNEVMSFIYG